MTEFVGSDDHADVAVVVVTYNNAEHIAPLIASLRDEAADQSVRLIIADNDSTDRTIDLAGRHTDVIVVRTGGNLGYAGGINVAMKYVGDADYILVLNPDAQIARGCLAALRHSSRAHHAAVTVPRIVGEDRDTYHSLRREPTVLRALGDALLGRLWPTRPAALAEVVCSEREYSFTHPIEWASGAALLIRSDVARSVGDWDEQFFLYSEETDFQRRVRDAGHPIWFVAEAVVHHHERGSGFSLPLSWLITVNRVRYARKHMSGVRASAFRLAVALYALARSSEPGFRGMLRVVTHESMWKDLPHASATGAAAVVTPHAVPSAARSPS